MCDINQWQIETFGTVTTSDPSVWATPPTLLKFGLQHQHEILLHNFWKSNIAYEHKRFEIISL